jgi:addiction module RelE/StbE family toxin
VRVIYSQSAKDDVIRQFRYYLVLMDVPEVAVRFRQGVQVSVESLREHPFMGPRYRLRNSRIQDLRVWPVAGWESVRIYYTVEADVLRVIRVLHDKRDVRRILEREKG